MNYKIKDKHEKYIQRKDTIKNECVFIELKNTLISIKNSIDNYNKDDWERSKKKLTIYELVYCSSKKYKNICNVLPVSRSYFKLHQMIYDFDLLKKESNDDFFSCCIAEGPGGFIHCLNNISFLYKKKLKKIYGITLISDDKSVPYWNNCILKNPFNKIFLETDGNIYNLETVNKFLKFVDKKCDLITCDGGFDYSNDYNKQEINSYKLLFCEIYTGLHIQKVGGNFVIKLFDIMYHKTLQLIYLLYNLYSEVYIYKPSLSRLSNSEKYVICKGFLGISKENIQDMTNLFNTSEKYMIDIPESFLNEMMIYNHNYINTQKINIETIIKHINKPCQTSINQVSEAIQWCKKYNLPINYNCTFIKNNYN